MNHPPSQPRRANGPYQRVDPWAETHPIAPYGTPDPYGQNQPGETGQVPLQPGYPSYESMEAARRNPVVRPQRRSIRSSCGGCLFFAILLAGLLIIPIAVYFLAPGRTNILLMGLDARPKEGDVGRTDTLILMTFIPLQPYVGALSIPRDLWVTVPGHGENRINTAHFFAEAEQPGSGPKAALETIQTNFGVDVGYYVRVRFTGFKDVVDAMGGVDVNLPQDMSGYSAGVHHLDGDQALALVRDREGSDDFFRMGRGQIFLKSIWRQVLNPSGWVHLPGIISATIRSVDTNVPVWLWPRLGLALLRKGPDGIDARSISREMVSPFITDSGADVLGPNWSIINPVLKEMFGQ